MEWINDDLKARKFLLKVLESLKVSGLPLDRKSVIAYIESAYRLYALEMMYVKEQINQVCNSE